MLGQTQALKRVQDNVAASDDDLGNATIFDELDIHPDKESARKIVDRKRTYFLTKYYVF